MLRDENGMLCGYVYVDVAGRDIGEGAGDGDGRQRIVGWCFDDRVTAGDHRPQDGDSGNQAAIACWDMQYP